MHQITGKLDIQLVISETNIEIPFSKRQILAALSVSIGSMVVGFASAYTSPALVTMREDINFTAQEVSRTYNHHSGIFLLKL